MNLINKLLLLVFLSCACVPVKKQLLVQNKLDEQKTVPLNSIVNKIEESPEEYVLQKDDIVSVKISSIALSEANFFEAGAIQNENNRNIDPALTGYAIARDGTIQLPEIGRIQIENLTIKEAEEKISGIAANYVESPTVYIRLLNFRISILGEVIRQGTFPTFNTDMTILEAIGLGFGLTEFADNSKVKVIRTVNDVSQIGYVNLLDENLISSQFYHLQPNDVIVVPPLKAKNFRSNNSRNISLILNVLTTLTTVVLLIDRL